MCQVPTHRACGKSAAIEISFSFDNFVGDSGLQNRDVLEKLLAGVTKARDDLDPSILTSRKPKIVLKIAPDLEESQIIDMAEVIRNSKVDGVIVSNTTIQRPKTLINRTFYSTFDLALMADAESILIENKIEMGGLSGPPVKPFSLKALQTLRANLPSSIPLIGCGGIVTGKDALDYAKAGATMVQVYTGFGYDGVGACRRIKDQLIDELKKEGRTWEQVVNEAVEKLSWTEPEPVKKGEASVKQLIEEAEELKAMLDKLGKKMET